MNAVEHNRFTASWRAFGESILRPRAILVVSAHWYVNVTAVTAMPRPRTVHDFYGFPQQLFDLAYPAPGLPELAHEIIDLTQPTWIGADADSWGLDHGAWSVLVHAFPDADVPVVQLSIDANKPMEYHVALGAKLSVLRERGVLILASGNVVHNLGAMDLRLTDSGYDWAVRFDDQVRQQLMAAPAEIPKLGAQPDYRDAAPTPDHFIPLLYFAGVAAGSSTAVEVLTQGHVYGSLSMTSYTLGSAAASGTIDRPGPQQSAAAAHTDDI